MAGCISDPVLSFLTSTYIKLQKNKLADTVKINDQTIEYRFPQICYRHSAGTANQCPQQDQRRRPANTDNSIPVKLYEVTKLA